MDEEKKRMARAVIEKMREDSADEYINIIENVEKHILPEAYPISRKPSLMGRRMLGFPSLMFREEIVENCGYALVSYDWVRPLSEWIGSQKCLEVMCGSGALAKALRDCGVDIIATDDFSWQGNNWFKNPWTEIEKLDCVEAVRKYGTEIAFVVCSWPCRNDSVYRVLKTMYEVNPDAKMIFIGEWNSDVCADCGFYQAALFIDDEGFRHAMESFKQVNGIHDVPVLLRYSK